MRRLPVTLTLGAVLLALMVATVLGSPSHAQLVRVLGLSWPDLEHLRLWRVLTNSLVQDDTGVVWSIVVLLPALAVLELRSGSAAAAGTYLLCDIASTVPVLLALGLAGDAGSAGAERLAAQPNVGSSAGLIGVLAAVIGSSRSRARPVFAVVLAAFLAGSLVFDWELAGVQHAIAAAIGAAVGLQRKQHDERDRRDPHGDAERDPGARHPGRLGRVRELGEQLARGDEADEPSSVQDGDDRLAGQDGRDLRP